MEGMVGLVVILFSNLIKVCMICLILEEKMFKVMMELQEVKVCLILGPRGKDGKNGGKTIIRVPCGTLVYEVKCEE